MSDEAVNAGHVSSHIVLPGGERRAYALSPARAIARNLAETRDVPTGRLLAPLVTSEMAFEIVFGRLLAVCVHPQAAWRKLPISGRLVLAATYFGAAYVAVLGALLSF